MSEDLSAFIAADDVDQPDTSSLKTLAAEMKSLAGRLDELEADRKQAQERYDVLRKRLVPDALAEAGMSGVKLVGGGSIHLRTDLYPSVDKLLTGEFHAWLRDHGHQSLIVPTVNFQTLRAWVREQRDAGAPLPPQVTIFEEPVAVLRKS